jgi:Leucine-rich repeat (LRR) protein
MRLKISFDALHQDEQKIFLDIACFFIGEERDMAIRIWDGSGWNGLLGFQHLQKGCLVEVIENKIRMHEQLRDMGREIAEASGLPRRIWRWTKNIDDLLQQFSDAITEMRGIRTFGDDNTDSDEDNSQMSCYRRWSHQLFRHRVMKLCNNTSYRGFGTRKLQLLHTEGDLTERILRRARSPNLIWLRWYKCPYSSLPSWIPLKNLRVLELQGNKLESLWPSGYYQAPLQLRELVIDSPLLKVPKSIGYLKHLELIVLRKSNLKTLPDEFCHLVSLKRFELTNCPNLKSLPDSFGYLINLDHIDLSHSSHLHMLPKSFGNLINLKYIGLSHSLQLRMLPVSFGNLIRLKCLDLSWCSNLTISRETLGNVSTLECIDLSYCKKIEILPPQILHQRYLKKLDLRGTNMKEMPNSIGELGDLEVLEVGSPWLDSLPPSLGHLRILKELRFENCKELKHLPASVGLLTELTELRVLNCPLQTLRTLNILKSSMDNCMPRLQDLELYNTKLSEVSFATGVCPILQYLSVRFCNDLVEVGTLPNALIELELTNCSNLRKIEGLCGLAKLQMLDISRCENVEELPSMETLESLKELQAYACVKLKSIQGLSRLTKLRLLNVNGCSELQELPGIEHCMLLEYLDARGCPKQWAEERVLEQLHQQLKVLEI